MRTLTLELPDASDQVVEGHSHAGAWERGGQRNIFEQLPRLDIPNDPLLQLAGIIKTDIRDVAEYHDEYIGRSIAS